MTTASRADVLLITVTNVETKAVFAVFQEEFKRNYSITRIGNKTYYDLGHIGGARTWLVRSEMGAGTPGGALSTVYAAIDALDPAAIIMVGIAFGAKPRKQRIGDVLVARQLMLYDFQRVGTDPAGNTMIHPRGDRTTASIKLLDRFADGALSWPPELPADAPQLDHTNIAAAAGRLTSTPKVEFGLVLSGDKLVDNQALLQQLLTFEPEAIGGEMEGAALYIASANQKFDWILVKAICDWADGDKDRNKEENQQLAARNAVQFAFHVLNRGGFASDSKQQLPIAVPQEYGTVLTVFASAPNLPRATGLKEYRAIIGNLRVSPYWQTHGVVVAPELPELLTQLRRHKPNVLHIAGEGHPDGLWLGHRQELLPWSQLSRDIMLAPVRLHGVIITAGYSAAGMATALKDAAGYCIAATGPLSAEDAAHFSEGFYGALARGDSEEQAFQIGRGMIEGDPTLVFYRGRAFS